MVRALCFVCVFPERQADRRGKEGKKEGRKD